MQSIYDKDDGQEIKQPYAVTNLHVPIINSKLYKRRYMYKFSVHLNSNKDLNGIILA